MNEILSKTREIEENPFFTARQLAVPTIFEKYWEKNKKYKEKVQ